MIKVIYLAWGRFWGLERYFSLVPGVEETRVGYANGSTANPSYEEVCAGSWPRGNGGDTVPVRGGLPGGAVRAVLPGHRPHRD